MQSPKMSLCLTPAHIGIARLALDIAGTAILGWTIFTKKPAAIRAEAPETVPAYLVAFDNGAASRDDVATELDVTKTIATRLLKQLADAGLLAAERADYARTAPDTTSREDAEKLFDQAFGAGASGAAEATDAAAFEWPKPASEVLLGPRQGEIGETGFEPATARPQPERNGCVGCNSLVLSHSQSSPGAPQLGWASCEDRPNV